MTPPLPQRKPERLDSSPSKGADLFGSLFSGAGVAGIPSLQSSSSATSSSGGIDAVTSIGSDFNVLGQGSSLGKPFLSSTSMIVLVLIAGGVYLAGRK